MLFMDVHRNVNATPDEVLAAHKSDLAVQDRHGVKYLKYWVNSGNGTVCCLVEGPNAEACIAVHREAHGLLPDQIIEVETGMVDAFLGGQPDDGIGTALYEDGTNDTAYRVILFTDIVGSTERTQRLGDDAAMELVRTHDTAVRAALDDCGGREVKHLGDGIMACFTSAARAVGCAVAIQKALAGAAAAAKDRDVSVRIGISAGEPVVENQDFFGAAVQLASRVCGEAEGGQILVANVVRELCVGKSFAFVNRGEKELKGFAEPCRMHEVVWRTPAADGAAKAAEGGSTAG